MSKSALYGRAPPVRSRRHVRIRRGFGPCLQPRTAGALPWQRPRDREPWVWIACVRPFTPSGIKSGLVVSRDTETEGRRYCSESCIYGGCIIGYSVAVRPVIRDNIDNYGNIAH